MQKAKVWIALGMIMATVALGGCGDSDNVKKPTISAEEQAKKQKEEAAKA